MDLVLVIHSGMQMAYTKHMAHQGLVNSHLDIRSCRVGEVHVLELNSTVKLFWNYALIRAGINGWFLGCVHVSSTLCTNDLSLGHLAIYKSIYTHKNVSMNIMAG